MKTPSRIVVFLGPDGAGKTTLLELVEAELATRGVDFNRYYFAPGFLKRYRPSGTPNVTTDPHARRSYDPVRIFMKVSLMLYEFNMGVAKLRRQGGLVLFDRFIHDLLIDPRRHRMGRVRWWMRAMLKQAPRPDLVVIITAPPDVIQSRKQEVTPEETARQVESYKAAARLFPRALPVENTGPPEDTAQRIVTEILRP